MKVDSVFDSTSPRVDQIRGQVDRILHSSHFSSAELMRLLLSFLADRAIEQPGEHLKVKEIATRVFHRTEDFDSQTDSVVRVHVGRLRSKLAEFYMTDGADDDVILEVPKGAYFLACRYRHAAASPVAAEAVQPVAIQPVAIQPVDAAVLSAPLAATGRQARWKRLILPAITALSLGLSVWLVLENRQLRRDAGAPTKLGVLPWSALELGDLPVRVVLADNSVGAAQDIVHGNLSLKEYINRNYLATAKPTRPDLVAVAQVLSQRQYTSLADAEIATRILRLDSVLLRRGLVRYARYMQLEDFKDGNNVIIGSYRANHWAELYQPDLNFNVEYDQQLATHYCRNRHPGQHEQAVYRPTGPTGTTGEAYAVVALLFNHSGKGHTLLITGTNTESTQAAGDFVTNAERFSAALRAMGIDPKGAPRPFEILLKVSVIAGSVDKSEVIAHRVPPYIPGFGH
jgi:hypothetical protein